MNKIIISFIFALSFFTAQAVSQNDKKDISTISLSQKVDSIEHELSYLKMSYELSSLNNDITMFVNEIYTKSLAIQLNIQSRYLDRRLTNSYTEYYDACKYKQNSISELITVKKTFFNLKYITSDFSKEESNVLLKSIDVIDSAYDSLESSMSLLKVSLETYNSLF